MTKRKSIRNKPLVSSGNVDSLSSNCVSHEPIPCALASPEARDDDALLCAVDSEEPRSLLRSGQSAHRTMFGNEVSYDDIPALVNIREDHLYSILDQNSFLCEQNLALRRRIALQTALIQDLLGGSSKGGYTDVLGFASNGGNGCDGLAFCHNDVSKDSDAHNKSAFEATGGTSASGPDVATEVVQDHARDSVCALPAAAARAVSELEASFENLLLVATEASKDITKTCQGDGDQFDLAPDAAGELYAYGQVNVLYEPTKDDDSADDAMSSFVGGSAGEDGYEAGEKALCDEELSAGENAPCDEEPATVDAKSDEVVEHERLSLHEVLHEHFSYASNSSEINNSHASYYIGDAGTSGLGSSSNGEGTPGFDLSDEGTPGFDRQGLDIALLNLASYCTPPPDPAFRAPLNSFPRAPLNLQASAALTLLTQALAALKLLTPNSADPAPPQPHESIAPEVVN